MDTPTDLCTITTMLLGVDLDPCGQPGAAVLVGECERGHTGRRTVCATHVDAFRASPRLVTCEPCWDEGLDIPIAVREETPDGH